MQIIVRLSRVANIIRVLGLMEIHCITTVTASDIAKKNPGAWFSLFDLCPGSGLSDGSRLIKQSLRDDT